MSSSLPPLPPQQSGGGNSLGSQYGLGQPGVMEQVASGLLDQVKTSIRAIPHLPAAITKGWNDPDASPDENSLRRRAVADAAMTLVSMGWGKLVTTAGMEGLPVVLRALVKSPIASTAAENALASMAWEGVDKGPQADYLGAAAGGAAFGGIMGGIFKAFGHGHVAPEAAAGAVTGGAAKVAAEGGVPARGGGIAEQLELPFQHLKPGQQVEMFPEAFRNAETALNQMSDAADQKSQVSLAADTGVRSETNSKRIGLAYALMKMHGVDVANPTDKYRFASNMMGHTVASMKALPDAELDEFIQRMASKTPSSLKTGLDPSHLRMYQRWYGDQKLPAPGPADQVKTISVAPTRVTPVAEQAAQKLVAIPQPLSRTAMLEGPKGNAYRFIPPDADHATLYDIGTGRVSKVPPDQLNRLMEMTGVKSAAELQPIADLYKDTVQRQVKNGGPQNVMKGQTWDEALATWAQAHRGMALAAEKEVTKPSPHEVATVKPTKVTPSKMVGKPSTPAVRTPSLSDAISAKEEEIQALNQEGFNKIQELFHAATGQKPTPAELQQADKLRSAYSTRIAQANMELERLKGQPRPEVQPLKGQSDVERALNELTGPTMPEVARGDKVVSVSSAKPLNQRRGTVNRTRFNEPGFKNGAGFRMAARGDGNWTYWTGKKEAGQNVFASDAVAGGGPRGEPTIQSQLRISKQNDGTVRLLGISLNGVKDPAVRESVATKHLRAILTKLYADGRNVVSVDTRDRELTTVVEKMADSKYLSRIGGNKYGLQEQLAEHPGFTPMGTLSGKVLARKKAAEKLAKLAPKGEAPPSQGKLRGQANAALYKAGVNPRTGVEVTPAEVLAKIQGEAPPPPSTPGTDFKALAAAASPSGHSGTVGAVKVRLIDTLVRQKYGGDVTKITDQEQKILEKFAEMVVNSPAAAASWVERSPGMAKLTKESGLDVDKAYRQYKASKMNRPPAANAPAKVTKVTPPAAKPTKVTPKPPPERAPVRPEEKTPNERVETAQKVHDNVEREVAQLMEKVAKGDPGTQTDAFQARLQNARAELRVARVNLRIIKAKAGV